MFDIYGHDLTRELQLIGFITDRTAVQLGVSLSWGAAAQESRQREMAQARSSATAGAYHCGNETHLRTSADGTDSV
jgi:hypothetical protein